MEFGGVFSAHGGVVVNVPEFPEDVLSDKGRPED